MSWWLPFLRIFFDNLLRTKGGDPLWREGFMSGGTKLPGHLSTRTSVHPDKRVTQTNVHPDKNRHLDIHLGTKYSGDHTLWWYLYINQSVLSGQVHQSQVSQCWHQSPVRGDKIFYQDVTWVSTTEPALQTCFQLFFALIWKIRRIIGDLCKIEYIILI